MASLWPYAIALVAVGIVLAVVFRKRTARMIRLGKAIATDKRLPRPVRWMFGVALAIKCVPVPDFGIDEVLLVVGMALLLGPYRSTFRAIREETK